MKRYIQDCIKGDLARKMVLLTGPRQVGKTYLAKEISKLYGQSQYLNYDNVQDRKIVHDQSWGVSSGLLVLDEIHKMKDWTPFLKGAYDGKPEKQEILVTGSSRLDTFRQAGESLAGRYFRHRLNPVSVKEAAGSLDPQESLNTLNRLGGFPEPFLSGSDAYAARWRNQYYTDLIREDILEFGRLQEIRAMRLLLEMLRARTGSPLSYASLSEDLKIAPNTVKSYVDILENLCIVFLVRPFHRNIARAIQKEPKLYFYDTGLVSDEASRLENTVAVCLKTHADYAADVKGENVSLCYLRNKDKKEVDFVMAKGNKPVQLIEVKTGDDRVSPALKYFAELLEDAEGIQLVHNLRQARKERNVSIVNAADWLSKLDA